MNKIQAFCNFWESFGIKAYEENTIPSKAVMPYLTYELNTDSFGNNINFNVNLYYRDSSWVDITNKAEEISKKIGLGGININFENGSIWLQRSAPFCQRMKDTDDAVRRIVLSLTAEYNVQD